MMRQLTALLLIALPWLTPFAPGPSPAVMPWLVALAAAACLVLLASLRAIPGEAAGANASFAQRWARPVAGAWLLAGVISSLIGLLQYFGAAPAFEPWVSQSPAGEAFANLRQRNQFATLTNVALAALLWWAAQERPLTPARKAIAPALPQMSLALTLAVVLAFGNAASSSRTGLLEMVLLAAITGIWGAWRQPRVYALLLAFGLAYVAASVALPWLAGLDPSVHAAWARLRSGDSMCASRLTLWSNVLQLIAQKPWSGWGWGELDYAHYTTLYDGPRFCDILDNAHNLPLHLAVELGIPAALLLCLGGVWWIIRQRPWRETHLTRQMAWSVLAVVLLHSLLEYPLWYGPFQIAFALCIGLLWHSAGGPRGRPARPSPSPGFLISRTLVAVCLMAACAYAAWDYHRVSQIYLAPAQRDAAYREDTLSKIRDSWLFQNQVRFAELSLTGLNRDNAQWTFDTAAALLHYSPEPRIIEKLIESAVMLGRDEEAMAHMARYRAAFPADYARWTQANRERFPGLPQRMP